MVVHRKPGDAQAVDPGHIWLEIDNRQKYKGSLKWTKDLFDKIVEKAVAAGRLGWGPDIPSVGSAYMGWLVLLENNPCSKCTWNDIDGFSGGSL